MKFWVKNLDLNYGIMISNLVPEHYRAVPFCTREKKKFSPKLVITYKIEDRKAVEKNQNDASEIYKSDCNNNQTLIVYDNNFDVIYKEKKFSSDTLAEIIEELEPGKYLFQLISTEIDVVSFQVVKK